MILSDTDKLTIKRLLQQEAPFQGNLSDTVARDISKLETEYDALGKKISLEKDRLERVKTHEANIDSLVSKLNEDSQ